jgi:hypothetical protein
MFPNTQGNLSIRQAGLSQLVDGEVKRLGALGLTAWFSSDLATACVAAERLEGLRVPIQEELSQRGGGALVREDRCQLPDFEDVVDIAAIFNHLLCFLDGHTILHPGVGEVMIAGISPELGPIPLLLSFKLSDKVVQARRTQIGFVGDLYSTAAVADGHESSIVRILIGRRGKCGVIIC